MVVFVPATLLYLRRTNMPMPAGRSLEAAGPFAPVLLLAGLQFSVYGGPALFALFPAITALGYRLGPRAVTAALVTRHDSLDETVRHQIGLVHRSGAALLTVVNDILDFSRVEAGQVLLDSRPASLTAVAEDALAIVSAAASAKDLGVRLVNEGRVQSSHMFDDHRIRQILLNFLSNAVRFTERGEIVVTVSLTAGEAEDLARVSVRDTGAGISTEAQSRLFQRFSQVDSSISRSHGGTGLGLAICRGLIELMGGKVGVESKPGEGSTFWFELSLQRADVETESHAEEADAALSAHVLVVDDHPVNRELAVAMLSLLGCTAKTAVDGKEAIEAAKTCAFDAIFMDVHMPGMDGLTATRAIRALNETARSVPIIAMSADVLPEQVEKCLAAGMVDSVGKPLSLEALQLCLARWVGPNAEGKALAA